MTIKFIKYLAEYFSSTPDSNTEELKHLLERANRLASKGNHAGITDLIKIVMRGIQSQHILSAYTRNDHSAIDPLHWWTCFGFDSHIPGLEKPFSDIGWSPECQNTNEEEMPEISLRTDILLPTAWHPSSIVNMLGVIGDELPCGPFKQDPNHLVTWITPLNIGFVGGGNHSIAQGIIRGEGSIKVRELINFEPIIEKVRYDGHQWISLINNQPLGAPLYKELGWAWELGRILMRVQP